MCASSAAATARDAETFRGSEQMFSAITRSDPSRAAATTETSIEGPSSESMDRPGSTVSPDSAGPPISPATRRTSNPSRRSAPDHLAASTDTPVGAAETVRDHGRYGGHGSKITAPG
ncbi:MAG: hypothetical protein M5T61_02850 [Acidimicrobiia bacterium]|nr:hypothetical protein [Acidimicrobiia bacterium]